jgi:hypothetical protein
MSKWMQQKQKLLQILLLPLILSSGWLLRTRGLDHFKLTDETKWAFRSANFTLALHRADYTETFRVSHPGVTTMWAGWIGISLSMPEYAGSATRYVENKTYREDLSDNGTNVMQILVPARQVVIAVSMLLLLAGYYYLNRLAGPQAALIGTLLLTFEPFYLGHTRILHVDGFLSGFMYLSTLAFLGFLKDRRSTDLIVSGVAAGLTWLTKTPGFFLAGGIALIAVIDWLWPDPERSQRKFWKDALRSGWPVVVLGVIGVVVFFALWPAMWVDPVVMLKRLARASLDYAVEGHSSPVVFNGVVYRDGIVPASIWQYYPLCYLWRVSPVALGGLALAAAALVRRWSPLDERPGRVALVGLVIFALAYIVFMSIGSKRSDRYVLPAMPVLSAAAGFGWAALLERARRIEVRRVTRTALLGIIAAAMCYQIALALTHLPYYLSYFNPLMGGSRKAPQVLQIGWGEGLDEAARYLNSKPGAENLVVATWYERVFSEFFVGEIYNIEDMPTISEGEIEDILNADYIVIYYHQFQRDMPENLLDIIEEQEPVHTLWFNGLEYVRIYDPDTFNRSAP